jgi:hypothetical protein
MKAFVDQELKYMEAPGSADDVSIHLLQKRATFVKADTEADLEDRCRRRCHYHPKHDCRLICRISCVKGRPVQVQRCRHEEQTTTTTTSKVFDHQNPPTEEETCDLSSTFTTNFNSLVVNTLGQDVENPRMVYKDVIALSNMLKNKPAWANRKIDLTITDASQKPRYTNNPGKNVMANPFRDEPVIAKKYVRDERNYTGTYLETIRINFDEGGSYVFRMTLTDSETGELAPVPLFPLTFYDIDGPGEAIGTCDALRVINGGDRLADVKAERGCFVHKSSKKEGQGREVNLPKDFEQLTNPQKEHSITYVYANKAEWDVQIHLCEDHSPQRYFVMKSSKVLACSDGGPEKGSWTGPVGVNRASKKSDA